MRTFMAHGQKFHTFRSIMCFQSNICTVQTLSRLLQLNLAKLTMLYYPKPKRNFNVLILTITRSILEFVYYLAMTGKTCLAFDAARSAAFCNCSDLIFRRYRKRRMKSNSILHTYQLNYISFGLNFMGRVLPFFRHHQETLNNESLGDLWTNSLEEAHQSLIMNDELHYFNKTFERFALS